MTARKVLVACSTWGLPLADAVVRHLRSSCPGLGNLIECAAPIAMSESNVPVRLYVAHSDSRMSLDLSYALSSHECAIFVLHSRDLDSRAAAWSAMCIGLGVLGAMRCLVLLPHKARDAVSSQLPGVLCAGFDSDTLAADEASRTVSEQVSKDASEVFSHVIKTAFGSCAVLPFRSEPFKLQVSRGGPSEVFHNVSLHEYCRYAGWMADLTRQLVTVLTLEPHVLISDIGCPEEVIRKRNKAEFLKYAERRGAHYAAFARHLNAIRIVVWEDKGWIDRNRDDLVPFSWLNEPLACYVVNRDVLRKLSRPIFLAEHTVFDDRLCMYDHLAETLMILHVESVMTDPRFGYQFLWGEAAVSSQFVRLAKFMEGHGIDSRPAPHE